MTTDRERHIRAWLCLAGVSAGGLAWVWWVAIPLMARDVCYVTGWWCR
jgi:hypothetical protein